MSRAHRRVPPQDRVELSNFRAPPTAKKGGSAERFYSTGADAESVPGVAKAPRWAARQTPFCQGLALAQAAAGLFVHLVQKGWQTLGTHLRCAGLVRWCPGLVSVSALEPGFTVALPCGVPECAAGLLFASICTESRSVQSSQSAFRGPAGGSLLLKPVAACVRCVCLLRACAACGPLPLFPSRVTWRRAASLPAACRVPCF